MNWEWAIGTLNNYIALLDEYDVTSRRPAGSRAEDEVAVDLDQALGAVQAIADQVRPGMGPSLHATSSPGYRRHTESPRRLANVLIGDLKSAAEIAANLAPIAPQLSADELHRWVWRAAASLWATNHRREAVQAAATLVNAETQTKVGRRDVSDTDLMNQIFSKNEPEPGKPRLRWPGDQTDIRVQSMNNGLRGYASGVFQTVRNAATHDPTDIPEQEALEQLAALSILARWIERCDLIA